MTTQQRPMLRSRMSGVIPPDGVQRDGFTVEQHTEQNKTKTKTSSARGVMEDRRRFGLLLLQRQYGEVVPILHQHKH
jgi:hypothetical protein